MLHRQTEEKINTKDMLIHTTLNKIIKHIDGDSDCTVSEKMVDDGYDLIITVPFLDSRIQKLSLQLSKSESNKLKNDLK